MFARMMGLAAAAMVAFLAVPAGVASAAGPAVSVAVPAPGGGGGGASGCYRVTHTIYGPYNLSFCLNNGRGSSYQVTGGGLNCNGGLDWYDRGSGRIEIDLYRASCGRGTDWTGDSMSCRANGWQPPPLFQGNVGGVGVSVAVPAPSGGVKKLDCTYRPVAGGYSPISITAKRI